MAHDVTMLVSLLEILIDPLKKPLPVLMVNWTVAPSTVAPVAVQTPVRDPVKVFVSNGYLVRGHSTEVEFNKWQREPSEPGVLRDDVRALALALA